MNFYDQIKGLLISNEVYKKVKDYSKNKSDVETYYNVEKLIIEILWIWENSMKYLAMKNWTHWVQNWVGVIILNY